MQNMTLVNIITEYGIYMFVVFLTQTEFRNIRKSKRVFKKAFVVRCLIKQYQYIFGIIPNMIKYGMEQLCTQSSCTQSQKDFQFLFLVNHQQPLWERPFKVSKNSTTSTLAGFGLVSLMLFRTGVFPVSQVLFQVALFVLYNQQYLTQPETTF